MSNVAKVLHFPKHREQAEARAVCLPSALLHAQHGHVNWQDMNVLTTDLVYTIYVAKRFCIFAMSSTWHVTCSRYSSKAGQNVSADPGA